MVTDLSDCFVGRGSELSRLQEAYKQAASGKTKVVSIVAERGLGKTRLVQKFYQWLASSRGGGYWPEQLDHRRIDPNFLACGPQEQPIPYFWWGLRFEDPEARYQFSDSALSSGRSAFEAHFGAYIQTIEDKEFALAILKDLGVDVGTSAGGATMAALTEAASGATGPLGPLFKAILIAAKKIYERHEERRDLKKPGSRPAALHQHDHKKLVETILAAFHQMARHPPAKSITSIPLIVVLDDAQWLAHDADTADFVSALLARVRKDEQEGKGSWPLLVLMTSWAKEWGESKAAASLPAALWDAGRGDEEIRLAGIKDIDKIIAGMLPGLASDQNADQRDVIANLVGGNPRLLQELLSGLDSGDFVEGNTSGRLTDEAMAELSSWSVPDFVAKRFNKAPEHIQRALALASKLGMTFCPLMVQLTAQYLHSEDALTGLHEGADPYRFVEFGVKNDAIAGKFCGKPYHSVAAKKLRSFFDETQVQNALAAAQQAIADNPDLADENTLKSLLAADLANPNSTSALSANQKLKVADALIRIANERGDARTAGVVAQTVLLGNTALDESADLSVLLASIDAYGASHGADPLIIDLLERCRDQARRRVEQDPSAMHRKQLAAVLVRLGTGLETLRGSTAAHPVLEEAIALYRGLLKEEGTLDARHDLAVAIAGSVEVIKDAVGPSIAIPLYEENVSLWRTLAESQRIPGAGRKLTFVLYQLGDILYDEKGAKAAHDVRKEALDRCRAHVAQDGSFRAHRDLAFALGRFSDVVEDVDEVHHLRQEAVEWSRMLYDAQATHYVCDDLASLLRKLADVVSKINGLGAGRHLLEECVSLRRECVAKQEIAPEQKFFVRNDEFDARSELAVVLFQLAEEIQDIEGPAVRRPLLTESAALFRAALAKNDSLYLRGQLTYPLSRLIEVVEAIDGSGSAKSLREEYAGLVQMVDGKEAYCPLRNLPQPGNTTVPRVAAFTMQYGVEILSAHRQVLNLTLPSEDKS